MSQYEHGYVMGLGWMFRVLGIEFPFMCPVFGLVGSKCRLQSGKPCDSHPQCLSGWCKEGVCFDPQPAGSICNHSEECLSDECVTASYYDSYLTRYFYNRRQLRSPLTPAREEDGLPQTLPPGMNNDTQVCMVTRLKLGSYCFGNDECASGRCELYDCFLALITNCWDACIPKNETGVPGDFCTHGSQCDSGICAYSGMVSENECKDPFLN